MMVFKENKTGKVKFRDAYNWPSERQNLF